MIIQTESYDATTNDVLDWIFFLEKDHIPMRINDSFLIEGIKVEITNDDVITEIKGVSKKISFNSRTRYWNRRGNFKFNSPFLSNNSPLANLLIQKITPQLHQEVRSLFSFFNAQHALNQNAINKYNDNDSDKLENLLFARTMGLKIPSTIISNNQNDIDKFFKKHKNVITKSIFDFRLYFDYKSYRASIESITSVYATKDLTRIKKDGVANNNIITMLQQYIPKKFELRIFYLKSKFYSMAIFSQENEKTKTDFRNYDHERPNRCVPYKLPEDIEQKLDKFMKAVDLNCGSIDMIYTPEGEYVFLEVNPVGQFQWLSKNCNYDIERQIAKTLLQHD